MADEFHERGLERILNWIEAQAARQKQTDEPGPHYWRF
jgi:hypothetical protein